MPLAVNVGAVATPLAFVVAVAVVTLPGKVPLGPLPGAVKVTVTPFIGLAGFGDSGLELSCESRIDGRALRRAAGGADRVVDLDRADVHVSADLAWEAVSRWSVVSCGIFGSPQCAASATQSSPASMAGLPGNKSVSLRRAAVVSPSGPSFGSWLRSDWWQVSPVTVRPLVLPIRLWPCELTVPKTSGPVSGGVPGDDGVPGVHGAAARIVNAAALVGCRRWRNYRRSC